MKTSNYLLLVTLLAFVTFQAVEAKSSRSRNGEGGRRNNSRNGHNRNNGRNGRNEGFKCPEMACPPISSTCKEVEYLILQFAEVDSSSDRIFECRGCDYCIDIRSFQKRDAKRHHSAKRLLRDRFECPGVMDECEDVRQVNVYLPGVRDQSWLCKACFDHVHQNT